MDSTVVLLKFSETTNIKSVRCQGKVNRFRKISQRCRRLDRSCMVSPEDVYGSDHSVLATDPAQPSCLYFLIVKKASPPKIWKKEGSPAECSNYGPIGCSPILWRVLNIFWQLYPRHRSNDREPSRVCQKLGIIHCFVSLHLSRERPLAILFSCYEHCHAGHPKSTLFYAKFEFMASKAAAYSKCINHLIQHGLAESEYNRIFDDQPQWNRYSQGHWWPT